MHQLRIQVRHMGMHTDEEKAYMTDTDEEKAYMHTDEEKAYMIRGASDLWYQCPLLGLHCIPFARALDYGK
jgi:hypothetical protein